MSTRRHASRRLPVVLVGALLLVGACSDDDTDGAAPPAESTTTTRRPTTTTTTTDPAETLEAEVTAAYEASSQAFIDAAAVPDPEFPAFLATHVGPMLEQRRDVLVGLQADGRVIRYPPDSQYRIEVEDIEIDGDVARLEVCVVDDGERVVVSTGEVVAGGVGTVQARAAMQRVDGTWKLAERTQEAEWEGIAGCAVD